MASELEVGKITTGAGTGGDDPKVIVGGEGNAQLRARHIDGKGSTNSNTGKLFLNHYSTSDITMAVGGGNVGIGKTPGHTLDIDGDVNIDPNHKLRWGGGNAEIIGDGSYNLEFKTYDGSATTTKLSISSTGLATFGNAMTFSGSNSIEVSGVTEGRINIDNDSTDTRYVVSFYNPNGNVGKITTNGSATAYNTSSDYRLKENLEPLTGALDRIDQLPVYRFNFKADPDTTVDGFVAHEVQAHVPEAVTGEKDAMRTVVVQEAVEAVEAQPATYWEEGDELPEGVAVGDEKTAAVEAVEAVAEVTEEQPDYQGIDQSKLVPLLVAAVKELKAKVEALEGGE